MAVHEGKSHPKPRRRKKAVKVIPGERIYHQPGEVYQLICCDCSLVHLMIPRIEGRKIVLQFWRDNRSTAAYRRKYR